MTDDLSIRRRRAAYRASHRGTKEMDVMIGHYAEATLNEMDAGALDRFERFLALPDTLLSTWLLAPDAPVETEFSPLVTAVRRFHGLGDGAGEPEQR
jgi:antitoxin CptB